MTEDHPLWTIRGVSAETRSKIASDAKAAGKCIGNYLNEAAIVGGVCPKAQRKFEAAAAFKGKTVGAYLSELMLQEAIRIIKEEHEANLQDAQAAEATS